MADEVDALIVAMTKKVKRVYGEAYREAAVQLGAFLQQFAKDDENMKQKVKDGAITEKEYKEWRDDTIVQARQYDSMLNTLAEDLVKADEKASSIINGYLPSAYALGVNSALFEVCKKTGYDIDPTFTLYDRHTVELLLKDDEALFPKSNINIRKDNKVTRQRLQNSVTKGILKGDSIDKIAKDMQQVTGMSYNSAVRAARTLTGSAQNLGRLESYKHAEEMGVKLDKIWVATVDMKTRDSHRHLDLERVPVDKPFSNGCMCPKDPNGSPEEVINCRCTMISAPMGFEYNTTNRYTKLPPGITYDEWKEDHKERIPNTSKTHSYVVGKDLTDTWKRNSEKFSEAIDDIVDAQGFNGMPSFAKGQQFDKAVKESSFIAQRVYGADVEEVAKKYQDDLYRGSFYISCTDGGSAYGKGLYCASDYTGTLIPDIGSVMDTYGDKKVNIVETFTLNPKAKIINHNELLDMKRHDYNYGEYKGNKEMYNMDDGVWAAMKGYDAIRVDRAEGHCSYTVVLNRTAIIFKEE